MPHSPSHNSSTTVAQGTSGPPRHLVWLLGFVMLGAFAYLARDLRRTPVPSPHSAPPDPLTLARVGDTAISANEFRALWEKRHHSDDVDSTAAVAATMEDLIRRELLLAEACRTGFAERADIRAAWRNFLVTRFREELETRRSESSTIDEEAIAAHYQAHAKEYLSPERRKLAVIHVPLPPAAASERRARLEQELGAMREQAVLQARQVRDFGDLAATPASLVASRRNGRDSGWLTRAQANLAWPAQVAETAFSLSAPGDVSPIVTTEEGWFLLKLIERQDGRVVSLDIVRERIRRELARLKEAASEDALFAELRSRHRVECFPDRWSASELVGAPSERALAQQPPSLPAR
ncbi:MAG: peptidyl-prolyl cis-trans isomerase [Verrucomicrobiales bacterium]|nr:peptidyl-prolyl cis-trans isomerase [Verrucomicrobiales bacterium]